MGRQCTVCSHPQRREIETEIINSSTLSEIVAIYPNISRASVHRHKEKHLPLALSAAIDAEVVANGSSLLAQVTDLQARTLKILQEAEREKEHILALRAIGEARRNLELLGKLAGELKSDMNVTIHTEEVQSIITHVVVILNQEIYDPNVLEKVAKRLQEAR